MSRLIISFLILIFSILGFSQTESKKLISVRISFMEALAPKDTTSSERFQKEYEYAIQTGKDLTREKLKSCGYEMAEEKVLYDASDTLQALEQAKKAEAAGAWLIVGPRRSNHYLLAVKGAPETPSVSIMASAKEVFELPSLHLSLAQSNQQMAQVLSQEVQKKFGTKANYISIVSEDYLDAKKVLEDPTVKFAKPEDFLKRADTENQKLENDLQDFEVLSQNLKREIRQSSVHVTCRKLFE